MDSKVERIQQKALAPEQATDEGPQIQNGAKPPYPLTPEQARIAGNLQANMTATPKNSRNEEPWQQSNS